jgi:hypothetical protein
MVFAVNPRVPHVWPHGALASAGQLGLLYGRMIGAAVTFPAAVILQEMLKTIY